MVDKLKEETAVQDPPAANVIWPALETIVREGVWLTVWLGLLPAIDNHRLGLRL